MRTFSKQEAERILMNEVDTNYLVSTYPDLKDLVLQDFNSLNKDQDKKQIVTLIESYKSKASLAVKKIKGSNGNPSTINSFLPEIIKARIALRIIEQVYISTKKTDMKGPVRFKLLDGYILQKLLFEKDFRRKPVSLAWFRFFWTFISDKKILMPLVNQKGIYCFYSKDFIKDLSAFLETKKTLEVGAGDGTLTRFLTEAGISCTASDDYSWKDFIDYPDFVERMDALEAIRVHRPDTVLCSWPPPGNSFEKNIFLNDSVKTYIVIGSRNPLISGNHEAYASVKNFQMSTLEDLGKKIIPFSEDNVVYLFQRK